jgi:hypothetical protein
MAPKAKRPGTPKRPRNPLVPQLWAKRPGVKPSAKAYSRKAKHKAREKAREKDGQPGA